MKALQMSHTFVYMTAKETNSVLNRMHFHIIILFHDLILKHYTYTRNCKKTEEYLIKNTSYLNVVFFPYNSILK